MEAIDAQLNGMVESFTNMLKATRVPDEEAEQAASARDRRERAPGDLLEVWAERLVVQGHAALHLISEHKRTALLSDPESLIKRGEAVQLLDMNVRNMRTAFTQEEEKVAYHLGIMRQEVQGVLAGLESSYYSSSHKGRLQGPEASLALEQLQQLSDK